MLTLDCENHLIIPGRKKIMCFFFACKTTTTPSPPPCPPLYHSSSSSPLCMASVNHRCLYLIRVSTSITRVLKNTLDGARVQRQRGARVGEEEEKPKEGDWNQGVLIWLSCAAHVLAAPLFACPSAWCDSLSPTANNKNSLRPKKKKKNQKKKSGEDRK